MWEAALLAGMAFGSHLGAQNLQSPQSAEAGTLNGAAVGAGIGTIIGASEERLKSNDSRVPIGPPIKPGERPTCDNSPSDQEIFRAIPRTSRGVSYIYEEFRDDIEIIKEKLVDRIDPPRFFPLIGPAQLHHCHWKCTVYYTETVDSYFPFPFRTTRRRAEVVYIDKDRLHLCESGKDAAARIYHEMTAPQGCPAGSASTKVTAKPAPAQQVQIDVTIASINRTALPNMPVPNGAMHSADGFLAVLQSLREDGLTYFLSQPKLVTVSGRQACVLSGQEIAVENANLLGEHAVTFKYVGTKVEILPTVKANGKIDVWIRAEISDLCGQMVADTAIEIKAGQTIAIGGLSRTEKSADAKKATKHDLVILVTPRLVDAAVIPAGHTEECETPRAAAVKNARGTMTTGDVVRMAKKGIAQDIILRQMELTNAVFNLTVDEIIELHDSGVSEAIIRAMQERRTGNSNSAIDPTQRVEQRMIESENLRQLHEEWQRFWMNDQPSHLTPYRIRGGTGPDVKNANPH